MTAISPVLRDTGSTGSTDVTVLAADAAKLGGILRTRAGRPPDASLARLAAAGTHASAVPVPGRPERLSVGLRTGAASTGDPINLTVIISDALRTSYEVSAGNVPSDGKTHTRVIDLSGLAGRDGVISYPVAVRGFRFSYIRPPKDPPASLAVTAIRPDTGSAPGPALRVPPKARWSAQATLTAGTGLPLDIRPGGLMTTRLPTATDPYNSAPQVIGSIVLQDGTAAPASGHPAPAGPIPAIVTANLAARAHVGVGSRMDLDESGVEQPITVVAIVPELPTTSAGAPAVLVDWSALGDEALGTGVAAPTPTEWWLGTRGGDTAPAAHALGAHPGWAGPVVDRIALRHRLRDAPLGGALQGALLLGFGAALVFAAIGFAVNTAVSARERVSEFAILRALGIDGRQVLGLVAVEQAFLVGLGLAGGLLLGIVVARLVVPHVVLTVSATAPYPPVHVIMRWPVILAMLAAIVVLLTGVLLLLVRSLRRGGPGQAMRLGEDR